MNRILTALFTGKREAKKAELTARRLCESLEKRVQRLEIALGDLEEKHAQLQKHHLALRGRFYGEQTTNPGGRPRLVGVEAVPFGDKAALRAAAGIKPGVRFNHPEE